MFLLSKDTISRSVYTSALVVVLSFYFLFNRHLTPRFELKTFADNLIPFSAPFGVLYASYLVLLWGSITYGILVMPLIAYKRFVASLISIQVVAYIFFILIPGHIVRPVLHEESFFMDVVRTIYAVDMPMALTPSLHVSNSMLIALNLSKKLYIRAGLIIWALLIILSTLFIKQHYLVDVISGMALSWATYCGFNRYWKYDEVENLNGQNVGISN